MIIKINPHFKRYPIDKLTAVVYYYKFKFMMWTNKYNVRHNVEKNTETKNPIILQVSICSVRPYFRDIYSQPLRTSGGNLPPFLNMYVVQSP